MSHRKIEGLVYAAPCESPHKRSRAPRGTKALGLRYERALAKALPKALHGQWFYFVDRYGSGHCQPDLIARLGDGVLVIEAKLTDALGARAQITELYFPVLRMVFQKPVFGIVALRHLSKEPELTRVVESFSGACAQAALGHLPTLHWLGRGPLDPHLTGP